MTKLTDIAQALNLDVSVISRALSPAPENRRRVNPQTRELILETARKMNYVPDRSAAFLRRKKAPTLLCYLPGYTDRLVGNLVMGISEEASRQNYPVNFFFGKKNTDFEAFCGMLKQIKHSGVITYPPQQMPDNLREELLAYHREGGHILFLNACSNGGIRDERFADIPQLQINDTYGGELVARHFISQGVTSFLATTPASSFYCRHQGFLETLEKHACSAEVYSVENFIRLYKTGQKTGIFAVADAQAVNIMLELQGLGYQAGRDYLLAGHDDQFMSIRLHPSLSTVHQPTREEGVLAVRKVINLIGGGSEENEQLNPWLMIRESSGGKAPVLEKPDLEEILY
ncbi:MAG: LacI family DNA-binding transcriptional regulator [Lentisphaeria bacterium]|nr:LacI family DNA-binding transcriptional regulator [Lentisphaeria bacterium]